MCYAEKQDHARSNSPVRYTESPRANGHAHGHKRNQVESSYSKTYETFRREYQDPIEERQPTPSPPIRRRSKEQVCVSFPRIALIALLYWCYVRICFLILYYEASSNRHDDSQWAKSEEKVNLNEPPSSGRTSSPVHVVQRTWESRSRDTRGQTPECDNHKDSSPRSRSISPKSPTISRNEKKSDTSSAPRPSKSELSFAINPK